MPILNRREVKRVALLLSEKYRAGKFTSVGKSFLERIEAKTQNLIESEVRSHPSIGKTLK